MTADPRWCRLRDPRQNARSDPQRPDRSFAVAQNVAAGTENRTSNRRQALGARRLHRSTLWRRGAWACCSGGRRRARTRAPAPRHLLCPGARHPAAMRPPATTAGIARGPGSVGERRVGWMAGDGRLAVLGSAARPDAATLRGLEVTELMAVQWIELCAWIQASSRSQSGAAHLCHG
jgi:hypothetical protein